MPDLNSTDYYRRRERQERTLATMAQNPAIAAIHVEMADRYLDLVWQVDAERGSRSGRRGFA